MPPGPPPFSPPPARRRRLAPRDENAEHLAPAKAAAAHEATILAQRRAIESLRSTIFDQQRTNDALRARTDLLQAEVARHRLCRFKLVTIGTDHFATVLQSATRARREVARLAVARTSATRIASAARRRFARVRLAAAIAASIVVQARARALVATHRFQRTRAAAIELQRAARAWQHACAATRIARRYRDHRRRRATVECAVAMWRRVRDAERARAAAEGELAALRAELERTKLVSALHLVGNEHVSESGGHRCSVSFARSALPSARPPAPVPTATPPDSEPRLCHLDELFG